jgi:hypothetical protein
MCGCQRERHTHTHRKKKKKKRKIDGEMRFLSYLKQGIP